MENLAITKLANTNRFGIGSILADLTANDNPYTTLSTRTYTRPKTTEPLGYKPLLDYESRRAIEQADGGVQGVGGAHASTQGIRATADVGSQTDYTHHQNGSSMVRLEYTTRKNGIRVPSRTVGTTTNTIPIPGGEEGESSTDTTGVEPGMAASSGKISAANDASAAGVRLPVDGSRQGDGVNSQAQRGTPTMDNRIGTTNDTRRVSSANRSIGTSTHPSQRVASGLRAGGAVAEAASSLFGPIGILVGGISNGIATIAARGIEAHAANQRNDANIAFQREQSDRAYHAAQANGFAGPGTYQGPGLIKMLGGYTNGGFV